MTSNENEIKNKKSSSNQHVILLISSHNPWSSPHIPRWRVRPLYCGPGEPDGLDRRQGGPGPSSVPGRDQHRHWACGGGRFSGVPGAHGPGEGDLRSLPQRDPRLTGEEAIPQSPINNWTLLYIISYLLHFYTAFYVFQISHSCWSFFTENIINFRFWSLHRIATFHFPAYPVCDK